MILSITPPPGLNNLYPTVRGRRIKSQAYRSWITEAGWQIKRQQPKPIKGPVGLWFRFPNNARRDLDGGTKAAIDLLVTMGIIEGDRWKIVKHISLDWHDQPAMMVEILPWSDGDAPKRRTGSRKAATAGKP